MATIEDWSPFGRMLHVEMRWFRMADETSFLCQDMGLGIAETEEAQQGNLPSAASIIQNSSLKKLNHL